MGTKLDLVGQKFGRLSVISCGPKIGNNYSWECLCDCGIAVLIRGSSLKYGNTTSCGCAQKDAVTKHGLLNDPVYHSWNSIKGRCLNPKNKDYKRYGAVGISICTEWAESFQSFYDYIGPRPDDKNKWSVERISNLKGYEPGNVKWALPDEQARNRGLSSKSKTGINGVTVESKIADNGKEYSYVVGAACLSKGDQRRRYFRLTGNNYEDAVSRAVSWRNSILEKAALNGYVFSEEHGTAKNRSLEENLA